MKQNSNNGKKPFKFEIWMLGALLVPFAIFMAVRGMIKQNSIVHIPRQTCQ
jgi:hypothetical protein